MSIACQQHWKVGRRWRPRCSSALGSPCPYGGIPEVIIARVGQPVRQPWGNEGSALWSKGSSPQDHWHSWVAKLGLTVKDNPNCSIKNCWAGSLHWCRHSPLHPDSCKNLHFSTTSPPSWPSLFLFDREGPTKKFKNVGVMKLVRKGA